MMTTSFRTALERHLAAIRERGLKAFGDTLSASGVFVITSDGRLVRDSRKFLEMHREWLESSTWSLNAQPVLVQEWPDIGLAVLELEYRDEPAASPPIREKSYLTLIFTRREGRWEMMFDQNTPCR